MHIFQPERYLLQKAIQKNAHFISGDILDVGAGSVSRYRKFFKFNKYITLDIEKHPNIDLVGTAENIPILENSFDGIICNQVLGDLPEPAKALKEFYRVLRPGGRFLITESFMNELHDEPRDFWRFTSHSLKFLAEDAGFKVIRIESLGGYFSVRAQFECRFFIETFKLYQRPVAGKIFSQIFKIVGAIASGLDKIDTRRKFVLDWLLIGEKSNV